MGRIMGGGTYEERRAAAGCGERLGVGQGREVAWRLRGRVGCWEGLGLGDDGIAVTLARRARTARIRDEAKESILD